MIFGPVVSELITLLLLDQFAVAAGNVEGLAKARAAKPPPPVETASKTSPATPFVVGVGRISDQGNPTPRPQSHYFGQTCSSAGVAEVPKRKSVKSVLLNV